MEKDSKEDSIKRIKELEKELRELRYKIKQIPGLLSGCSFSINDIKRELERLGL